MAAGKMAERGWGGGGFFLDHFAMAYAAATDKLDAASPSTRQHAAGNTLAIMAAAAAAAELSKARCVLCTAAVCVHQQPQLQRAGLSPATLVQPPLACSSSHPSIFIVHRLRVCINAHSYRPHHKRQQQQQQQQRSGVVRNPCSFVSVAAGCASGVAAAQQLCRQVGCGRGRA